MRVENNEDYQESVDFKMTLWFILNAGNMAEYCLSPVAPSGTAAKQFLYAQKEFSYRL